MTIRRRIIWLTIFWLMLLGGYFDRLTFGMFLLLVFIGVGLVKMFDTDPVKPSKVSHPPQDEDDDLSPDDVIRVRRRAVEQLRNSLMRHHNSRGTDKDYQASHAAKETTEILQVLNVALASKRIAKES